MAKSKTVVLRLDSDLRRAIDEAAERAGVTPSDLIRHAAAQIVGRPDLYSAFGAAKRSAYGAALGIVQRHMRAAMKELGEG